MLVLFYCFLFTISLLWSAHHYNHFCDTRLKALLNAKMSNPKHPKYWMHFLTFFFKSELPKNFCYCCSNSMQPISDADATANYVKNKYYSGFMHSINKLFSSTQITSIFTNNLADIQNQMSFYSFNLFIHPYLPDI